MLDEAGAFLVLSYIVQSIFPRDFFENTDNGVPNIGYQREKLVLIDLAGSHLKLDDKKRDKLRRCLDINGPGYIQTLGFNYMNFETHYETMSKMILEGDVSPT
jgi:hypothetical protein